MNSESPIGKTIEEVKEAGPMKDPNDIYLLHTMEPERLPVSEAVTMIPDNAFVVIRTNRADDWMDMNDAARAEWKRRKICGGLIVDFGTKIETLSDRDLARAGLMRVPATDYCYDPNACCFHKHTNHPHIV